MEKSKNILTLSPSPNIKTADDTRAIMLTVALALTPPGIMSLIFFGIRPLIIIFISIACCMGFETLYCLIMKKPITVKDCSALVTGLLLAYVLPASVPYWVPVVGSFFAIIIVKMLFGGLGCNIVNPALAARAFLMSWASIMTTFPRAFTDIPLWSVHSEDLITSPTTLVALSSGPDSANLPSVFQMFFGETGGCIGETSSFFLLIGFAILLFRKIITWHVPVFYVGTVAVICLLFPMYGFTGFEFMLYNILSGGLLLGAIFMATDYTTSPVTAKGKIIFAVGCGILTMLIRLFGNNPEGVCYSILLMNVVVPYIDKISHPRRYGTRGGAVNVK